MGATGKAIKALGTNMQRVFRGSSVDESSLIPSLGHEHYVRGISTTPDKGYAATHGDYVKEYEIPASGYVDYFDLADMAEAKYGPEWTDEQASLLAEELGYIGSMLDDPMAGIDYRVFSPESIKALGTGLDMSHAARMQRAEDLGFDTSKVYYHGTLDDIAAIDPSRAGSRWGHDEAGFFATTDPESASWYGSDKGRAAQGGNVLPVMSSHKNPMIVERGGGHGGVYIPETGRALPEAWDEEGEYLLDRARAGGHDAILYRNDPEIFDPEYHSAEDIKDFARHEMLVSLDPSQIRSVNAAFDPAKKSSADLMGSADIGLLGGIAAGGGAALGAGAIAGNLGSSLLPQDAAAYERIAQNPYNQRIEATNARPEFVEAANFIRDYTESPLGGSWFDGVADLLEKVGHDERREVLDYIMAGMDIAP